MSEYPHQRKLSNLILDINSLSRLSVPFLTLAVISIGIVVLIQRQVMAALENTALFGVENLPAMNALHELQSSIMKIGVMGLGFLCLVCLAMWVFYSHRIFGPMVPLRRHVHNLINGDYSSRIHPRAKDEFKELAADLNNLAESLSKKKS